MCRFIYIGLVLLASFLANKCDCKNDIPLHTLFQVIPHFKEIQSCNRIFTTKYGISVYGVRHISYKAMLYPCEKAATLCRCMHDYLNQKDLIKGSTPTCCNKNGFATLTLRGTPDPTIKNMTLDNPLDLFKNTFEKFERVELENHNCRALGTSKDKNGCVHFKMECDLFPDSPCEQDICDGILVYFNQDHWLGKLVSTCTTKGNILHIDMHSTSGKNCRSKK